MSPKLDFGDTSCSSNLSSFLLSPSLGSNCFGQRQRKKHWVQRQGSDSLLCHLWTQNQLLSQGQTSKSSLKSGMSSNGAATPGCPLLTHTCPWASHFHLPNLLHQLRSGAKAPAEWLGAAMTSRKQNQLFSPFFSDQIQVQFRHNKKQGRSQRDSSSNSDSNPGSATF